MDSGVSGRDMLEGMSQYGSSSGPRNLTLGYLRTITNNFSDERLLGEGGFGKVYKGVLPNGETIAVKKLKSTMPEVKDKQFENEAHHLMRLKHPNVVRLVGWCYEAENMYIMYNGKYICAKNLERLLCLEYMPKGNLRDYLSDESSGLTWGMRYNIIEGICYGLHYLHEKWQPNTPIIHMDLKPENILLDNNMVPKIADFGWSRLFSEGKTSTCRISRHGTLGYMAPEYIDKGLIKTKSDIFSLGVIIIEILTGQRDYPRDYPDETGITSKEFTELVLNNWRHRLQKSLSYTSLEIDCEQIRRCIQIGLDCVKLDWSKRPTISQIIMMLHRSESANLSGRKEFRSLTDEVCENWANTSEAPSSLEKEEARRTFEIDRLVLKPPPLMVPPVICEAGDILRSFAPEETEYTPTSRPGRYFGGQYAVKDEEEDDAVSEDLSLGDSSEYWTANSSLSTPDMRFRKVIHTWMRGALLGSGSFGMVYEAITDEGFFFAVREVNLFDQGSNAQQCIFQLEQEIALLSQFGHENIVQYYGTDKEESKIYVFHELVTQGSLASLYLKYQLQNSEVTAFTRQILNGLTYLHERNIVHRDIKCANIMVDASGSAKLADFGLAKEITKFNVIKSCEETVHWMAPEVVNPKKTYGPAADIWSLGCTVLEMLTRQIPYPDLKWTQALYRIGRGEAPAIPSALPEDARDFISQCVQANPEDRPSASKLLEHPFINKSISSVPYTRRTATSCAADPVVMTELLPMASSEAEEPAAAAAGCCLPRARWRHARRKAKKAARAPVKGNHGCVWRKLSERFTGCILQGDREARRRTAEAGGGAECSGAAAKDGGRVAEDADREL